MDEAGGSGWEQANMAWLAGAVAELKALLRSRAQSPVDINPSSHPGGSEDAFLPALEIVSRAFKLSQFERDILLLCAAAELDQDVAALCGALQNDPSRNYPTFGVALTIFPDSHWSAFTPSGPLRRWRLIELAVEPRLTAARLRIDERVMHLLAGISELDQRLAPAVRAIAPAGPGDLVASHEVVVKQIVACWSSALRNEPAPIIQLCGDPADCRPIAAEVAARLRQRAAIIAADLAPNAPGEFEAFLRLLERETRLAGIGVLVLEPASNEGVAADPREQPNVSRVAEGLDGLVMLCEHQRRRLAQRTSIAIDVGHPQLIEQRQAWRTALGTVDSAGSAQIDTVCAQFSLPLSAIRSIAIEATADAGGQGGGAAIPAVWGLCRARLRARLDALAQRIDTANAWDDLVLPERETATLKLVAAQMRQRLVVYEDWGFAAKSARGLGISALFAGPSGTGKTMAAEVVANELRLDLYRIDLSSVVSKYIGETEKNLRRVFDAAEESGAVLLFDEADALFGKRSEVKDSHDRYANVEVSYLLQRMEAYRGLAILTTNMKSALDTAFLRRLRFIVQFPFPDAPERAAIWQRVFPAAAPLDGIDHLKLARMRIAGGNIRNIAMNAAFLAADAAEPVRMRHVLAAARSEYTKLERPLTAAEFEGWD
jgi:MoxR-like ATPase